MDLLTSRVAAEKLGVSPRTVNRMAADGRLPVAVSAARAFLFHAEDVRALVEREQEEAAS